jgi:hypothetical protein
MTRARRDPASGAGLISGTRADDVHRFPETPDALANLRG